jgi:RecB family exonuclease
MGSPYKPIQTRSAISSSAATNTILSDTEFRRWQWESAPRPGSPEQKIFKEWLTQRYHAPSDDLNQPVDLQAAALYEEVIRGLMISVEQNPQRPQWKQDSFFRRYSAAAGK